MGGEESVRDLERERERKRVGERDMGRGRETDKNESKVWINKERQREGGGWQGVEAMRGEGSAKCY